MNDPTLSQADSGAANDAEENCEIDHDPPRPGLRLLQSYLVIAGGYLHFFVISLTIMFAATYFFYLPGIEGWKDKMVADPDKLMKGVVRLPMWCWLFLLATAGTAFWSGSLTARFAPFGRFGHGVLLAVLLFVSLLQVLLADERLVPQWTTLVMLGLVPIMTLLGAKSRSLKMLESAPIEETAAIPIGEEGC